MNLFKNNLKNYGTINPKIKPNVFNKGGQMPKLNTPDITKLGYDKFISPAKSINAADIKFGKLPTPTDYSDTIPTTFM
jgi:hypothetical protein